MATKAREQPGFWVRAVWDAEHQVYVSESNIKGLHIETETMDAFHQAVLDLAPELIVENHLAGSAKPPLPNPSPIWNYGEQPVLSSGQAP